MQDLTGGWGQTHGWGSHNVYGMMNQTKGSKAYNRTRETHQLVI